MSNTTHKTRRDFLKTAGAAVAATSVITGASLGANGSSPTSEQIVTSGVGEDANSPRNAVRDRPETKFAEPVKGQPVRWIGCGSELYADQWPEEYWDRYIEQMVKARIEYVRLFEFAWGALEPEIDRFDLDWADRLLAKLDAARIGYVLGTPSAGGPRWLHKRFPDATVVGPTGGEYAARRNLCPSHSGYRERVSKINRVMAKRWGRRPGLLAWQVDNEMGHPECRCSKCRQRFIQWLQDRFRSEEHLNRVCGLAMWSHQVRHWEELEIPTEVYNPTLRQLFREWNSEKWLEFAKSGRQEIRKYSDAPVLVNMMAPWHGYDHFNMREAMDIVAVDYYPLGCALYPADSDLDLFMGYTRAISRGGPFWIMETQAGGTGRISPPPGAIQDWSLRMVAHGANAITFFRWDTPNFGGEELSYGVVGPGLYTDRIYEEVGDTARRLRRLRPLVEGSIPERASAAVYFNYRSWWKNLDQPDRPIGSEPYDQVHNYIYLLRRHFQALHSLGVQADLCGPGEDMSRYRLLVLPQLVSLSREEVDALVAWTENGGVLLLAEPGFTHDENGVGRLAPYPAPEPLRRLTGVRHGVGGRLIPGCHPTVAIGNKLLGRVQQWAEQLEIDDPATRILAAYAGDDVYARWPALTLRKAGKGWASLLGCMLDDYAEVYRGLQKATGLDLPAMPSGWWIRRRLLPDGRQVVFQKNVAKHVQTVNFTLPVETEQREKAIRLDFQPGELKVYVRSAGPTVS